MRRRKNWKRNQKYKIKQDWSELITTLLIGILSMVLSGLFVVLYAT